MQTSKSIHLDNIFRHFIDLFFDRVLYSCKLKQRRDNPYLFHILNFTGFTYTPLPSVIGTLQV